MYNHFLYNTNRYNMLTCLIRHIARIVASYTNRDVTAKFEDGDESTPHEGDLYGN